ncbi:hypothetical protein [Achromobacter kerstersii]
MVNDEFNAIGYATEDPRNPGEFPLPNRDGSDKSGKKLKQQSAFIDQIGEGSPEHAAWATGLRQLPPYMDLSGYRVAHACWDDGAARLLADAGWMLASRWMTPC